MCSYYNFSTKYKKHDYYLPQRIGPGALRNDKVKRCYVCSQNGFDEPVSFRKLPDGSWQLLNYFTGEMHEHKLTQREEDRNKS